MHDMDPIALLTSYDFCMQIQIQRHEDTVS